MILAAGLSPAWQQVLCFDELRWGEVNRARQAHWCASGKVLNIGLAAHYLGANVLAIAPVGGLAGEAIRREFAELGIDARFVTTAAPTRVCTTLLDAATSQTTELVENAPAIADDELAEFVQCFQTAAPAAEVTVLTGSLPDGAPTTLYAELLASFNGPAVLDIRGPELQAVLDTATAERPWLVKPNREELAMTVGRPFDSEEDLYHAMRELNARGAAWVVVSQGAGAVWATSAEGRYRFMPPAVASVVNPIGCGDCLAAGIAVAWQRGLDTLEAIRWGMAAAAENLPNILPARLDLARVMATAAAIDFHRMEN